MLSAGALGAGVSEAGGVRKGKQTHPSSESASTETRMSCESSHDMGRCTLHATSICRLASLTTMLPNCTTKKMVSRRAEMSACVGGAWNRFIVAIAWISAGGASLSLSLSLSLEELMVAGRLAPAG